MYAQIKSQEKREMVEVERENEGDGEDGEKAQKDTHTHTHMSACTNAKGRQTVKLGGKGMIGARE